MSKAFEAKNPKSNNNFAASYNLITQFNSLLPNIKIIIKNIYLCYIAVMKCFKFLTMLMLHIDKIKV